MEDNLHPLTELMLARMKSHPEEFEDEVRGCRWDYALSSISTHGTEADALAIRAALRPIMMGAAHKWAMDELLNGDERRLKHKEEEEAYERLLRAQQISVMQQASPYGVGGTTTTTATSLLNNNAFRKLIP
jgi:hypothetical protein